MGKDAYRKRKREYARTPEQRAKRTAYMRIWREKNREKHNALARGYYKRNKEQVKLRARERWLRTQYGLTLEQYEEMLLAQRGVCAICSKTRVGGRLLHIDHDHATGVVRGLLCSSCNGRLGWYEMHRAKIDSYLAGIVW